MGLKSDLEKEVSSILCSSWTERDGTVVPSDENLKLGNDAVKVKATVLYADMADSTSLVDKNGPRFAAAIYKAFLHCAAKIIRKEGGEITAYDGDRIMAVFIGDSKNTSAVRSALKIKGATENIINPIKTRQYPNHTYKLEQSVGIDSSELFVARTGVRGANDLVWVGRAANHAAKLSALPGSYTYITADVYNSLASEVKLSDGVDMWTAVVWANFDKRTIYRSGYRWNFD
jgi:class 3 adenylate cyclase